VHVLGSTAVGSVRGLDFAVGSVHDLGSTVADWMLAL
jgi:hypothetical protein